MKVIDLLRECRNGIRVEIEERIFSADGNSFRTVFTGAVGSFGKTGYEQEEITCISIRENTILISFSKVV